MFPFFFWNWPRPKWLSLVVTAMMWFWTRLMKVVRPVGSFFGGFFAKGTTVHPMALHTPFIMEWLHRTRNTVTGAVRSASLSTWHGIKKSASWLWEAGVVAWILGLTIITGLGIAGYYGWQHFSPHIKSAVAPHLETENSSIGWYIFLGAISILGLLLLIAGIVVFRMWQKSQREKNRVTGTTSAVPSASGLSNKKKISERLSDYFTLLREHPGFYPIYIVIAWFLAMGVLGWFSEEMATWGWPRYGTSPWEWLHNEHPKLYYATPFIILLGTWFALVKTSRTIRALGILIWIPLGVVWFVALSEATQETNWYKHRVVEREAKKREIARANQSSRPKSNAPIFYDPVVAGVGQWSELVVATVPDRYLDYMPRRLDQPIEIEKNEGRKEEDGGIFIDQPGETPYTNLGKNIRSLRFRSLGTEPVTIDITLMPK